MEILGGMRSLLIKSSAFLSCSSMVDDQFHSVLVVPMSRLGNRVQLISCFAANICVPVKKYTAAICVPTMNYIHVDGLMLISMLNTVVLRLLCWIYIRCIGKLPPSKKDYLLSLFCVRDFDSTCLTEYSVDFTHFCISIRLLC